MRTTHLGLFLFLLPAATGCGMLGPMGGTGAKSGAGSYEPGQDSKDMVRSQEAKSDQITDPILDQELDKQQKEVQHALAMVLGQEGPAAGMPTPEPSSQAIAELRAAKFKMTIDPVQNASGGAVASNFVQLNDSFTARVQALQGKLADGSATPGERAEIMKGVKQVMKLNGLKSQVGAVSHAALMTNVHVQTGGLTVMKQIAGMVAGRKQMSMDFNDDDYARVKRILTRQKKWEALAAATMGILAAYEAVVPGTGDPKALDAIANATMQAFPLDPQVSDDDAKNYVSHLSDNAMAQKAKYEGWMRQAYGDAVYEAQYKASIDHIFDSAANAAQTKSAGQVASDAQDKYNADLAKCARGEPTDPGSLVGPAKCKAARAQATGGGGDGSGGSGGAGGGVLGLLNGAMLGQAGGGGGGGQGGDPRLPGGAGKAMKGVAVAQALASGDTAGALQGAADMFPGDGPIANSLQGVAALQKGDYKGALKSALGLASLIPGGAVLKEGLGVAGKLLNLFG